MIKFLPLGGAGEIGASCFYLNISGSGIILDCGMHPLKVGLKSLPKFDLVKDEPIDFALISHAHQDHLSALPYLVQKHPYVRIVTTPQTRAVAELTLHNSVSILKDQIDEEDQIKIYTHDEIDLLIRSIEYKAYKDRFKISGYKHNDHNDIFGSFHDAGHILGSAGILIEHGDKKIFYTGDINLDKQALLPGAVLPDNKIDILILETTYGATDSETLVSWKKESARLASSINKILIGGGSVLIPVFSLGKMQEIISTLWSLMLRKKLPVTDIYSGGISYKISRVYDYNRYVVNRIDPEFEINAIPQKDLYAVENYEDFFKSPCIVLAPSGMMMEGTASYNLARRWIKQSDSAIFTVGYMEESTPGYLFSNAVKGDKLILNNSTEEEVKCDIEQFRFSAHSKREELLEIVKKLKPEIVILIHGDPPAIDWMGASILKIFKDIKLYQAEIGKPIIL